MGQRRKAREVAAQILYALDFAEVDAEYPEYNLLNKYPELLAQLAEAEHIDNAVPVLAFAEELIKNTIINKPDISAVIERHSENWNIASIAKLDRSILEVAVYELMYTGTPAAVIINEAIEIGKKYCSEGTGKFLNGILDALHKELVEKEKIESVPG